MRALEMAERVADQRERVLPGDLLVLVARGVVAHRLGEPSHLLEVMVAPPGQLGHRVRSEEVAVGFRGRELPGDVLDAVLADVETETVGGVRPGAPPAVAPARP